MKKLVLAVIQKFIKENEKKMMLVIHLINYKIKTKSHQNNAIL